jgi:hypothetical protein
MTTAMTTAMTAAWLSFRDRRRGDTRPTAPVTVVLASTGEAIGEEAINRAAALAGGAPATVVSIAKVHGSAFGLPNPGLLPNRRERQEQRTIVEAAIEQLGRRHVEADGQIIVTRSAGKAIGRVALGRGASHVVLQAPPHGRLRLLLEGDPVRGLRRALRHRATLVLVTPGGDELRS